MPSWWSHRGDVTRRLDVLELKGWCPSCGRPLEQLRGTRLGAVAGECAEHGPVEDGLTA